MKILGVGSLFTLAFIGGILFMVSVGCGGSDAGCVGSVTFQGKAFEGKGKSADEAKKNACNVYCREADPEFEARYRIWLDSPKGKAAGSPSKQESIFKDKELLLYVTETCAGKCAASMDPSASCK